MGTADGWGQMTIYLGHDLKNNVILSVRTSVIVTIYTSIECENDCFEEKVVKLKNSKFWVW